MFSNYDITSVISPVRTEVYNKLLIKAAYPRRKRLFLIRGFKHGFSIQYHGNRKVRIQSPNLKLRVGNKLILWNKVMKEVRDKRFAGPYLEPPYQYYIQSPIGLVPKDGGKETRLIFHLSHPRKDPGKFVNGNIPEDYFKVKYKDFDMAVRLCLLEGKFCNMTKSDMKSAFQHLRLRVSDFCLLLMKAESPLDGRTYFFIEKALSFGSSISCAVSGIFGFSSSSGSIQDEKINSKLLG